MGTMMLDRSDKARGFQPQAWYDAETEQEREEFNAIWEGAWDGEELPPAPSAPGWDRL